MPKRLRPERVAALFGFVIAAAGLAMPAAAQTVPDLVSTDALRVCGSPAAMPFSDRKKEGFENKIADIVGEELGLPVRYYWLSQGPGFVRNTLQAGYCDVIMGYVMGGDPALTTNPYYRSVYVLVVKPDGPLADVKQLSDPKLKGKHLGVIAATPVVDHLQANGLLDETRSYSLLVDREYQSPAEDMLKDLQADKIDGALLWGPIGGYFAGQTTPKLKVIPLVDESARPPLEFRISFGIRQGENDWKHRLNAIIVKRQSDFNKILASYGVPLIGFDGKLMAGP